MSDLSGQVAEWNAIMDRHKDGASPAQRQTDLLVSISHSLAIIADCISGSQKVSEEVEHK